MNKILVLEDDENRIEIFRSMLISPTDETIYVTNASDAIKALTANVFDVIYLDHDLGGRTYVSEADENTGSRVVKYLTGPANTQSPETSFIIHSLNYGAAQNMKSKLIGYGYLNVAVIPFTVLNK